MTKRPRLHIALIFLTLASVSLEADTRTLTGEGNNLLHPDWGSANQALVRMAPACYADGISEPGGVDRPNPRILSKALSGGTDSIPNKRGLSDCVWAWGQFIDHDITRIQQNPADAMPIGVHPPDPLSPAIPFFRSAFDPDTGLNEENPRQQINAISSFIDGSAVYGSDSETHRHLRTFAGGQLLTSPDNLLPRNTAGLPMDSAGDLPLSELFLAGDERANENPGLLALHTLWVREHNHHANRLLKEHPDWNDEALFQQARRIVIGEIQNVTYGEFLPLLLGELSPGLENARYDPAINPTIFNEFATALYRVGHTMTSSHIRRGNEEISLAEAFFQPHWIQSSEDLSAFLEGLSTGRMQEVDSLVVEALREQLFGQPGEGGMDLVALNIQRGRDHGIANYSDFRETLGLTEIKQMGDMPADPAMQESLSDSYSSITDMDLWVAALSETHLPSASLGETLAHGIALQFQHLRDGDRFFFLFDAELSDIEKETILNTDLATVIARNTTTAIDGSPFLTPSFRRIDSDGDGTSNVLETTAGTNPFDPASQLKIDSAVLTGGNLSLTWQSVPGRTYRIVSAEKLEGPWQELGQVAASSEETHFHQAVDRPTRNFFRIEVLSQ